MPTPTPPRLRAAMALSRRRAAMALSRLRAAMALSRLRAAMALSRLRAAMALVLTVGLLAGGTAVAQEHDSPPPAATADEGADATGDDAEGSKKNKKNKKNAAEDACEDAAAGDAKTKNDKKAKKADNQKSAGDAETDPCAPPRCKEGQVDLAPNEEEANCVSQARLNQLISDFEAAAAEEAAALDELALALDELSQLNEQLDDLRERLGEVQLRLAAAQADAGFAAIRREVAGESLDDVAAALTSEEDELRSQAVEAYMGGDEVELATSAAMLELEDYTALETAREYASVVIGDQLATVDHVEALRNAVAALEEVVAAVEAAALADAERVASIEVQAEELVAQQRLLVTNAEAEAAGVAERIGEIQAQKQAYANELRMKGAGGGAIGQLLRASQVSQLPPEASVGLLGLPLENTRLGSPFGPRVHPIFGDARMHTGIDMSGTSGEPILASADGIVVVAEETGGYGNVVVVDHGNTVATLYAHMTADAVDVGQTVVEGELLGFVGSTGYSTGPHLHFEVRVNGTPVDPMLYLVLG